jgi:hypothetical protein
MVGCLRKERMLMSNPRLCAIRTHLFGTVGGLEVLRFIVLSHVCHDNRSGRRYGGFLFSDLLARLLDVCRAFRRFCVDAQLEGSL